MLNADATLENAYGWAYGGVALPDYGSVAERYSADGTVCGIELFLSTLPGYFQDQSMDLYIWDSDGQFPNNVLAVSTGVHISTPDFWPAVSTFDLPLQETEVSGEFFIGYWGNWPGQLLGWYIAADIDGPGGYPVTKVAPGIGLPTGWIEVPRVWGTTQALGIGAWISGIPNPAERTSWGAIKGLYK